MEYPYSLPLPLHFHPPSDDYSTEASEEPCISRSPPQFFQPEEPYVPPLQISEPESRPSPESGFRRVKYQRKRPVLVSH